MIRRIAAMAVKEFLHLKRDRRTTFLLLGMPAVLLVFYGFALSFDVEHVRLAIVDQDNSRQSREAANAFVRCGFFDLVWQGDNARDVERLLDAGRVQAALVIPPRYGATLAQGREVSLQFVLDGADARMATTVLGYARQIAASVTPVTYAGGRMGPVVAVPRVWYNPNLSSPIFLVPGLVAFIMAISAVVATALAVVREKERGTMEALRATPLRAIELLVGKTIPYFLIGFAAAAGCLVTAWAVFDMPMQGSIIWLAVVTVLFLAGSLGWGVFLSTVADTQQMAFQLGLLSSMLPNMLLSGFIFPISSMPPVLRLITHIVPARYFLAALREIVLKGAGMTVWWPDALGLVVFAAVVLLLAAGRIVRSL
ncbi:MAG: ABC transporter permease [Candidatus Eisenbacteria bacterium]|jgi:ABC-2 type transport system permease protein|nr:ABC transporter permease [Candidatus Eisenbacteria bacterium]